MPEENLNQNENENENLNENENENLNNNENENENEANEWYYADGVKGEGDRPEYLLDKYPNLAEQAKAYPELSKKFGAFTGAPEKYEYRVSEQAKEAGFVPDPEDPMLESVMEFAKKNEINQEGFDGLVELYAMEKIADAKAEEERTQKELEALGNHEKRIDDLQKWGEANLPKDMQEAFAELFPTARSIEAMEMIIGKTLESSLSVTDGQSGKTYTEADVLEMQFALDEYGNRKTNDPVYRKEYERISKLVRGTGEARRAIS